MSSVHFVAKAYLIMHRLYERGLYIGRYTVYVNYITINITHMTNTFEMNYLLINID